METRKKGGVYDRGVFFKKTRLRVEILGGKIFKKLKEGRIILKLRYGSN